MRSQKRILFIVKNLQIGGVEKSLIALMKHLSQDPCYNIMLFLISKERNDLLYEVPENIQIMYASSSIARYMKWDIYPKESFKGVALLGKIAVRILQYLKADTVVQCFLCRKYRNVSADFVISYTGIPGIWDYLAMAVQAKHRYAYLHTDPYIMLFDRFPAAQYYAEFDKIICVSNDVKRKLDTIDPQFQKKSVVVYNLLDKRNIESLSVKFDPYISQKEYFHIVTVSRIDTSSKRIDRALECASILKKESSTPFIWHIVGGGPDYQKMLGLRSRMGLENCVQFHGYQVNPYPFIRNADLFVMTSDFEGFGLVLIEAQYLSVPVVTTCFESAYEIVEDGVNGYITEKAPEALSEPILMLMNHSDAYARLSQSIKSFKPTPKTHQIEEILGDIADEK